MSQVLQTADRDAVVTDGIGADGLRWMVHVGTAVTLLTILLHVVERGPELAAPFVALLGCVALAFGLVLLVADVGRMWHHRRLLLAGGLTVALGAAAVTDGSRHAAVLGVLLVVFTTGQVLPRPEAVRWYAGAALALVPALLVRGTTAVDVVAAVVGVVVVAVLTEERNRRLVDSVAIQSRAATQEAAIQELLATVTSMSDLDESAVVQELLHAVTGLGYEAAAAVTPAYVRTVGDGAAALAAFEVPLPLHATACLEDAAGREVTAWPLPQAPGGVGRLVARAGPGGVEPWQRDTASRMVEVATTALVNVARFEAERASARRLAQVDGERNDFVSSVSHELRTPLTVVKGLGHTLASGMLDLESVAGRELLVRMDSNAQRLEAMITTLLDVSRVHRRGLETSRRDVVVADVVAAAVDRVSPLADRHNLVVDATGSDHVSADAELIEHVVENLVMNACKYTPPESTITVAVVRRGADVEVVVEDDGPGIEPSELPRLTDRFFRGGSTNTRVTSGLGLGLSLVRDILEAHDTSLVVASRLGEGARFSFTLPVVAPGDEPDAVSCDGTATTHWLARPGD